MSLSQQCSDALTELAAKVREDLARIGYASGSWSIPVTHEDSHVLDVAIVGAGQGGQTTCFALRRQGISNVEVFDRAQRGGRSVGYVCQDAHPAHTKACNGA